MGAGNELCDLLGSGKTVVVPGIVDPLSALLVERIGFECAYLGGLVAAARIGTAEPLLTLTEQVAAAREITNVARIPLIVDGHAGFGDPEHVGRTVAEFESAGVAGIHIEDALSPARQLANPMIPVAEMVLKLENALAARRSENFIVIARTEALLATGDIGEVISRLKTYRSVGVDALMPMVFDIEHGQRVADALGDSVPLIWLSRSRRDLGQERSTARIRELGYQIILYPPVGLGTTAKALIDVYTSLRNNGVTGEDPASVVEAWKMIDDVVGVNAFKEAAARSIERLSPTAVR